MPPSAAWMSRLQQVVKRRTVSILAGTWNVNEQQPSQYSLHSWLGNKAKGAELVIVGLQEIEMGTGSVAQAAMMDKLSLAEKGNVNAAWWRKSLHQVGLFPCPSRDPHLPFSPSSPFSSPSRCIFPLPFPTSPLISTGR